MYSNKRIVVVDVYNDADTNRGARGAGQGLQKRLENGSFPGFDPDYDLDEGHTFNFGAEDDDDDDEEDDDEDMPSLVKSNGHSDDFITVVKVDSSDSPSEGSSSNNSFVTMVEVQEEHFEEVTIYRLPGERLGMALKFEGGMNSSDTVSRVFIQSINPDSPAARAQCSTRLLREGDEILKIDGQPVSSMTRIDCVSLLRDAPVCIKMVVCHKPRPTRRDGELRPVFPRKKKGPPPPVPPRKSSALSKQQHHNLQLDQDGDYDVIPSVRETVLRLEARSAVRRPVHPPPLPPQKLKMDPCFDLDDIDSSLKEKPNFPGVSLSTKLPGWEELMLRRAGRMDEDYINGDMPVKPDVYMDLIAEEDRQVIESESDDTGSSVSTVRERFSRTSTANSSFSDHSHTSHDRDSTFDLEQVLSPFEQLERELDADGVDGDELVSAEEVSDDPSGSEELQDTEKEEERFENTTSAVSSAIEPPESFQDNSLLNEEEDPQDTRPIGDHSTEAITEDSVEIDCESNSEVGSVNNFNDTSTFTNLHENSVNGYNSSTRDLCVENSDSAKDESTIHIDDYEIHSSSNNLDDEPQFTDDTESDENNQRTLSDIKEDDHHSDKQLLDYQMTSKCRDDGVGGVPKRTSHIAKPPVPEKKKKLTQPPPVPPRRSKASPQVRRTPSEDSPPSPHGFSPVSRIPRPISQRSPPSVGRGSVFSNSSKGLPVPESRVGRRVCVSKVQTVRKVEVVENSTSVTRMIKNKDGSVSAVSYTTSEGSGEAFSAIRAVSSNEEVTERSRASRAAYSSSSTTVHHLRRQTRHSSGDDNSTCSPSTERTERFSYGKRIKDGEMDNNLDKNAVAKDDDIVSEELSNNSIHVDCVSKVDFVPCREITDLEMAGDSHTEINDEDEMEVSEGCRFGGRNHETEEIDSCSEDNLLTGVSLKNDLVEDSTGMSSDCESSPEEGNANEESCNVTVDSIPLPYEDKEYIVPESQDCQLDHEMVSNALASTGFGSLANNQMDLDGSENACNLPTIMESAAETRPLSPDCDMVVAPSIVVETFSMGPIKVTDNEKLVLEDSCIPFTSENGQDDSFDKPTGSYNREKYENDEIEEEETVSVEDKCLECLDRVLEEATEGDDQYEEKDEVNLFVEETCSDMRQPVSSTEREMTTTESESGLAGGSKSDTSNEKKYAMGTPRTPPHSENSSPPPTFSRQPPDGHEFPPDYTDPVSPTNVDLSDSEFANKGKPSELEDSGIFLEDTSAYLNSASNSSSGVSTYGSSCSTPSEDGHQVYTSVMDCISISKVTQDLPPRIIDEPPSPKSIRSEVCIEITKTNPSFVPKESEVENFISYATSLMSESESQAEDDIFEDHVPSTTNDQINFNSEIVGYGGITRGYKDIEPVRERRFSLMEEVLEDSSLDTSTMVNSRCKSEDNLLLDDRRMADENGVSIVSIKDRIALFSKGPSDYPPVTFKSQQYLPISNKSSPTMRSTGSLYQADKHNYIDDDAVQMGLSNSIVKPCRRTSTGSIPMYPSTLYGTYDSPRTLSEHNKYNMSPTLSSPSLSSPSHVKDFDNKIKNSVSKDDSDMLIRKDKPFISSYPQTQLSSYRYSLGGLNQRANEDVLTKPTSLSLLSLFNNRKNNSSKLKGLVIPKQLPSIPTVNKELPTILSCTSVLLSKPETIVTSNGQIITTSTSVDKISPLKSVSEVKKSDDAFSQENIICAKTISPLLSEPPWKNGSLGNLPKYSPAFKRRTLELPNRQSDSSLSNGFTGVSSFFSPTTPTTCASIPSLPTFRSGYNANIFNVQTPTGKPSVSSFPSRSTTLTRNLSLDAESLFKPKSSSLLLASMNTTPSGVSTLPRSFPSSSKSPYLVSSRSFEEPLTKSHFSSLAFTNSPESKKTAELAENQKKKLSNMSRWLQNGTRSSTSPNFSYEPDILNNSRQSLTQRISPPFQSIYTDQTKYASKHDEKDLSSKPGLLSFLSSPEMTTKGPDLKQRQCKDSTEKLSNGNETVPSYDGGIFARGTSSFGSDRYSYWLDNKRTLSPDSDDDTFSSVSLQTEDSRHLADDSLSDATSDSFDRGSTEPDFKPRNLSQQRTVLRTSMDNTDSVRNFRALAEKWQQRAGESCDVKSPPMSPPPPPIPHPHAKRDLPRTPTSEAPFRLPPSLKPRSMDQMNHEGAPKSAFSTPHQPLTNSFSRPPPRPSVPRPGAPTTEPSKHEPLSSTTATSRGQDHSFMNGRTPSKDSIESIVESKTAVVLSSTPAKSPPSSISAPPVKLSNCTTSSMSVTDIRKAFECQVQENPPLPARPNFRSPEERTGQRAKTVGRLSEHVRMSSVDSTASESETNCPFPYGPLGSVNLAASEKFGSVSSLASTCSVTSSQDASQLVEETKVTENGEELQSLSPEITAVVLHRETPRGSIGITLAGGADYEVKEITVHKVISGSLADKDGRIRRGDRILSINGRSMQGVSHREALDILKAPRYDVVLVLLRDRTEPTPEGSSEKEKPIKTIVAVNRKTEGDIKSSAPVGPTAVEKKREISLDLMKDGGGLGFSLEGGKDSPLGDVPLRVKRVFTGGIADRDGKLKSGDELVSINGQSLSSMTRTEAWNYMKKLPDGVVTISVRPCT